MDLPATLYGQLYLLAYDRKRHQFRGNGNSWLFGYTLRAAMLSDLYLSGHLEDRHGKASRTTVDAPVDPVLSAISDGVTGWDWARMTAYRAHQSDDAVLHQLEAIGWVSARRRRRFGVISSTEVEVYDRDLLSALADRVRDALHDATNGLHADTRLVILGLLGVLGEMPTLFSSKDIDRHHPRLRDGTLSAIPPVMGLHHAVESYHEDLRTEAMAEQGRMPWRMLRDVLNTWN